MKKKMGALQPLIAELDNIIAAARAAKLEETVTLLKIARLDLTMRAHDIAADELELLSFALVRGLGTATPARRAKPKPPAPRRSRRKSPH
jgi:hypothetical protein